jgi:hypothetical protein
LSFRSISHEFERLIGGFHQPHCERTALSFECDQDDAVRLAGEHGFKFPGKVDGVTDAGVHALTTDKDVDMRGVALQERPAFPEAFGER